MPTTYSGQPVTGPLTDTELRAAPIPVTASIDPTGLATAAKQDTGNTSLSSIDSKLTSPLKVEGKDIDGAALTSNPLVVGGKAALDVNSYAAEAATVLQVAQDGFGNNIIGLAVKDFSRGSAVVLSAALTSLAPTAFWSGNNCGDVVVDISGTWTGSITVGTDGGPTEQTLPMRHIESGAIVQAITANGVYVVYGAGLDAMVFRGDTLTGTADLFAYSQFPSADVYTHVSDDLPIAHADSAGLSNVSSSATSVQLLAANTSRKGLILVNDSSAVAYIKFGATASTSSYTLQMAAGASLQMQVPIYRGRIDAIWASANGAMRVTELT